ncbi:TolC family protein [Chitinophaga flava]|nr:hypothetical protein [Chitinophaga flava]
MVNIFSYRQPFLLLTALCIFFLQMSPVAQAHDTRTNGDAPTRAALTQAIASSYGTLYFSEQAKLLQEAKATTNTAVIDNLLNTPVTAASRYELLNRISELELQERRRNNGLSLNGGFQQNFKSGLSFEEDMYFRNRAYAGIDWALLGNKGFFDKSRSTAKAKVDQQINDLLQQKQVRQEAYPLQLRYLTYIFTRAREVLTEERLQMLEAHTALAADMHQVRLLPSEQLIRLKGEAAACRQLLEDLHNFRTSLAVSMGNTAPDTALNVAALPLLELNPGALVAQQPANAQLTDLYKQQYELSRKQSSKVNLHTWLRYNNYTGNSGSARNFGSAGLTVAVPLTGKSNVKALAEQQALLQQLENDNNEQDHLNGLLNLSYEYTDALHRYQEAYGQQMYLLEKIRKESLKASLDSAHFSPVYGMDLVRQYYAVAYEMLSTRQLLYMKLVKAHCLSENKSIMEYTKPVKLEPVLQPYAGQRSVYIWSESFSQYSNSVILAYMGNNHITEAILSPGEMKDNSKLTTFLQQAAKQGITVSALIGNNKLLNSTTGEQELVQRMETLKAAGFVRFHLDIEPHALPDWRQQKDTYLQRLQQLVSAAAQWCARNQFAAPAVSIPVFYPESFLQAMAQQNITVYAMAYERKSADDVLQRTAAARAILGHHLVIALSAADYDNRNTMEQWIQDILTRTGESTIAIHDLKRMLMLDQRTIFNKEGETQP